MIKNVTVLGAGTMGHGIAHVFARHGCKVSLYEPVDAVRLSAPEKIREDLQFMVDEDYTRYYPYKTLASKVLGFTGG